ncbi:MAG: class I SAM-dependent methyltransferase, partial [Planctomycetaceae bacterium]
MNAPDAPPFHDPGLVDFGGPAGRGRRLELLGGVLVDRPLSHATGPRKMPDAWSSAGAIFGSGAGRPEWRFPRPLPDPWQVALDVGPATLALEVRPAPSGQVGVFLEQADHWRWLAAAAPRGGTVLSLFGHSGAASLALAAGGAEVVHVDASRQAIALARRNAEASGLSHLPVRWVCEDAVAFVARQARRGGRFAGAVLDPPSWGHGPRGQAFAIDRDLAPLLADVARLLEPPAGPVLVTCHSPGWRHDRLQATLLESLEAAGFDRGAVDRERLAPRAVAPRRRVEDGAREAASAPRLAGHERD